MSGVKVGLLGVVLSLVGVLALAPVTEVRAGVRTGVELADGDDNSKDDNSKDEGSGGNSGTKNKYGDGNEDPLCNQITDEALREAMGCKQHNTIPGVLGILINVVISLTGIIAVGAIVYGGIMYISSAGDPAKAKRARDVIIYSIVGLLVAVMAYAIVLFVTGVFG